MKMETEITAISLNCWGIAAVSKDRIPRMEAIATELASGKYDFAFLQEVWTNEDYIRIKTKTVDVLPYTHYFYSGVIGAGICIFSRSRITAAFFHQWAVNGYVHKIQHGDWFGGKGIGLVQVIHDGLKINLYTTHLHAEYDRVNDEYLAHRVTQAFDTAQFINMTAQKADVVIVGGDLNTEPGDLAYRVIVHSAQLRDSFFEAPKPNGSVEIYTCEAAGNSYTPKSVLKSNPFGKRIDFVIYKAGDSVKVTTKSCTTPLPKLVPGQSFSYSDHEAVVAKLKVVKSETVTPFLFASASKKEALEESMEVCSQAMQNLESSKKLYYGVNIASVILLVLSFAINLGDSVDYLLGTGRFFLALIFVFTFFMSVIWSRMEMHGILSGYLAMTLELEQLNELPEDTETHNDDRWCDVQMGDVPPQIIMPKFK